MTTHVSGVRELVEEIGYAFLEEYQISKDSYEVARLLGAPIAPWVGGEVQTLMPRATANPNTYSGMFGLSEFPYHTDLAHRRIPPRYLMLRCVKGYQSVHTKLIDSRRAFGQDLLNMLDRCVVKPRRPQNGSWPLLRLSEKVAMNRRIRWDSEYLNPASQLAKRGFQEVIDLLRTTEPIKTSLTNAGDTIVIDNWRVLHSRSAIKPEQEDRCIERVYLGELK